MAAFDLDKTEAAEMMQDLAEVLHRHLRLVPDVVLIVRRGEDARTFFGSEALTTGEDPVTTMRQMLKQALEKS